MLFRPIFYGLLSLETWAFRYDFLLWQITNFLLHLIVLWQMLCVFYLIWPSLLAGFFVAHFSVFYLSQEMVIWHHMGGNLLFNIFLMQAFFYFIKYVSSHQQEKKYLWGMVAVLSLTCFTHEFGVFCCVIFVLALYCDRKFMLKERGICRGRFNHPCLLFIPVGAYSICSLADYCLRGLHLAFPAARYSVALVGKGFLLVAGMLGQGLLFPYYVVIAPQCRSTYVPSAKTLGFSSSFWEQAGVFLRASFSGFFEFVSFLYMVVFLVIVFLLGSILKNKILQKKHELLDTEQQTRNKQVLFLGTSGLFFLFYVLVITNGRLLTGGEGLIRTSLYYFYFLVLFLTLCGYICLNLLHHLIRDRYRILITLVTVLLSLSTLLNGVKSHRFNSQLAEAFGPLRDYIVSLDNFVKEHKQERQFSFVLYWSEVQYEVNFIQGKFSERQSRKGDGIQLLFRKYYKENEPKYYLFYTIRDGLHVFKDRPSAVKRARKYYGGKPSPPAVLFTRHVS